MSNPFRRTGPPPVTFKTPTTETDSADIQPPSTRIDTDTTPSHIPNPDTKKRVKSVKFLSPPPSSPLDGQTIAEKQSASLPQFEFDEKYPDLWNHSVGDDRVNALHEAVEVVNPANTSGTPANPFAKTLATLEGTEDKSRSESRSNIRANVSTEKPVMDVDAFQRMLMTGNSGVDNVTADKPLPRATSNIFSDDSADIDGESSFSSKFPDLEAEETHLESPRRSYLSIDMHNQPEETSRDGTSKVKPPAPIHRHGKPLPLRAGDTTTAQLDSLIPRTASPSQLNSSRGSSPLRSPSTPVDVHKPLPAAPSRASHDSDRTDIFDREAIGKVPEPPSPVQATTLPAYKRGPPPPPTRRHSQLVADSKLGPITGRLSPSQEEDDRPSSARLSVISPAPPPPPTRRPGSIRHASNTFVSASPDLSPAPTASPAFSQDASQLSPSTQPTSRPPPPPSRHSSTRSSRPPSIVSVDLPPRRSDHVAPPPPQPRRQRATSRGSLDASGGTLSPRGGALSPRGSVEIPRRSGESVRRSFDSVGRRGSFLTADSVKEEVEEVDSIGRGSEKVVPRERQSVEESMREMERLRRDIEEARRGSG